MKRVIVALALIVVVVVGAIFVLRARGKEQAGEEGVETVKVERGTVELTVSADGILQPLTTVAVKSYAGGNIDVLAVDVGDEVIEGDLIGRIDPTDSQTAYDQAVADLDSAQARLTQAQAQAGGQPAMTQAAIAQAQASHYATGKDLERLEQATHPQAHAQARSALEKAQANLAIAERAIQTLKEVTHPQERVQAKAALDKARASLAIADKDLERLQQATNPQGRAQARAALDKATANLDIAEKDLTRVQGLREQGFVPQSELDAAINRRDLAQAELASAQERWNTLDMEQEIETALKRRELAQADLAAAQDRWDTLDAEQQQEVATSLRQRDLTRAELASAQERWNTLAPEQVAELEAARARVAQARAALDRAHADGVQIPVREADVKSARAQVARAQAQAKNARTMLDYTTIRAPRSGVILTKYAEEGTIITSGRSMVAQGADIVELGDLSKMFVEVKLDEADVASVRVGQAVQITVDAFPDETSKGVVTKIDPQAVTEQNITTVLVTVEVENPDARLKPGMTASCEFMVGRRENVLVLPSRVLIEVADGHMVMLLQADGEQVPKPVKAGLKGEEQTEVISGLKEGDDVVLSGLGEGRDFREMMRQRARERSSGGFIRRDR